MLFQSCLSPPWWSASKSARGMAISINSEHHILIIALKRWNLDLSIFHFPTTQGGTNLWCFPFLTLHYAWSRHIHMNHPILNHTRKTRKERPRTPAQSGVEDPTSLKRESLGSMLHILELSWKFKRVLSGEGLEPSFCWWIDFILLLLALYWAIDHLECIYAHKNFPRVLDSSPFPFSGVIDRAMHTCYELWMLPNCLPTQSIEWTVDSKHGHFSYQEKKDKKNVSVHIQ